MTPSELVALSQLRMQAWAWRLGSHRRQRPRASASFSTGARARLLLVSLPDAISQSQIFPFHFYKDALYARWGYEVREVGLEALLADPQAAPRGADVVCFQAWFDKTPEQLRAIVALLRRDNPGAPLAFLDPCAPTDLRFATSIGDRVDFYVKKHVLRDRAAYHRPTLGDTNLTDWFGRHQGEDMPQVHFKLPQGFLDKLLVGPSFVTAPSMLPRFCAVSKAPPARNRAYDLHARLGGTGDRNWYGRMRAAAVSSVRELKDVAVTPEAPINKRQYLRELGRSKICFSPFGYGEVCWRDYEAVYSGALLLKPDMSHLETFPNVFVANSTYVPVRWDFADLASLVDSQLSNEAVRHDIVDNAYATLHAFARSEQFVDHFARVLTPLH